MHICLDCGNVFEEPKHWTETHDFMYGPYEEWNGCPKCSGAYVDTYRCDCCDEWITDDYIKIGDKRYCQDCCQSIELGEE